MLKQVAAQGLGHEFPGTQWLFRGLDATLDPGEVVAVVGPSGSGKSTLLSLLAGWVKPVEGAVTWTGVDHVGWVFQNPHGVPRRTALDHVALPLLARGRRRREAAAEAAAILTRFGLGEVAARPFRALSGGEAQRLMLARAVATACDLLLVDEPTAQLDLATAATVNAVLANIAQDDVIVVVATHDPHTRDACTRVIDLADYQTADTPPAETPGVSFIPGLGPYENLTVPPIANPLPADPVARPSDLAPSQEWA
jgi:ABC-type lipoprotein export system ATPase subunit